MRTKGVIIVTGMDRSGTSWITSALQDSGVFIGESLFEANRGNPFGYFEDKTFLNFHIRLLQAANLEGLHLYNSPEVLKRTISITEQDVQEAQELIRRRRTYPLWGFKDPRAVLFLDFWQQLIPELKVICLYRFPLEICLSLFTRGDGFVHLDDVFLAFEHRMRQALAFKRRHPEQLLLANIHRIIANPVGFEKMLGQQFNLSLPGLANHLRRNFRPEAFSKVSASHETLLKFYRCFHRTAIFFEELERAADLPDYHDIEHSPLVNARRQAQAEMETVQSAELESQQEEFFIALIEESLSIPATKRKIIEGFLESVKIKGGIQYEQARLHQHIADLQQKILDYEHFLQSQDLITRHFLRLTLNNLCDVFRNPARIKKKLHRYYQARIKQERISAGQNQGS